MAALRHGDFDLNGYVIGGDDSRPVYAVGLDTGVADHRGQDEENPSGDDRFFGRDLLSGPTWTFEFRMGSATPEASLAALAGITRCWRSAPRDTGAESVLRYSVGGRTRRVYGRPRRFSQNPNLVFIMGHIAAAGQFVTKDSLHYGDELQSLTVTLVPGDAGGLVSPLISPLTTVAGGTRQGIIPDVGGDAPAPLTATFRGPVTNPSVSSRGWVIGLNTSLAYDQSVTVDTRNGTVLRNDGASLGGALTRRTYLPEARLQPGAQEIIYTGTDPTGTSSCTVAWRPAFYGF